MPPGADEHFQLPADFAKEIGNAISMADDFFPEAFKEMLNPLNADELEMLTDPSNMVDQNTEEQFKLDRL